MRREEMESDVDYVVGNQVDVGADDEDGAEAAAPGERNELIAKAQSGDEAALQSLLQIYLPLMKKTVYLYSGQLDGQIIEGDDLAQEAAKSVIELVLKYAPESPAMEGFGAYLKQMLRWRLANYIRRERIRMGHQVEMDDGLTELLEQKLRTKANLDTTSPRLRSALRQLSPKQRAVMSKLYRQERTIKEVAAETGVSEESVRRLRRRAEERVRRFLANWQEQTGEQ